MGGSRSSGGATSTWATGPRSLHFYRAWAQARPAVALDTWYRSTHQRYRKIAIIRNGATLMAVEAQQGTWEIVGKHFEDVLTTVVFGS